MTALLLSTEQMSVVYALSDGERIKIGFTNNLRLRKSQIERELGRSVSVVHVAHCYNPADVERSAHLYLGGRGENEWFDISVETALIALTYAVENPIDVMDGARKLSQKKAEQRYAAKREKKPVMCRLDTEQMARLDKARGKQARGAFLLQALLDKLPER